MANKAVKEREYEVSISDFGKETIVAKTPVEAVCKLLHCKEGKDIILGSVNTKGLANVIVESKGLRRTRSMYKLEFVVDRCDTANMRMRDLYKKRNITSILKFNVVQYDEDNHRIRLFNDRDDYILFEFNKINTRAKVTTPKKNGVFDYDDSFGLLRWYLHD